MDGLVVAVAVLTAGLLWLAGRARTLPGATATTIAGSRASLANLLVALMVFALLSSIAIARRDYYEERVQLANGEAALVIARSSVQELKGQTTSAYAHQQLDSAWTDLSNATFIYRETGNAARMQEFSAAIGTATDKVDLAGRADPKIATSNLYQDLPKRLAEVQQAVPSEVSKSASSETVVRVVLIACAVFAVLIIGVLCVVILRHSDGTPGQATKWVLVYSQPLAAIFAVFLGLFLALWPEISESTAKVGSGLVGLGVGYWLKGFS